MLVVRPVEPADAERWEAYVGAHPDAHFGQRLAWRDLTASTHDVRPAYSIAVDDGRVRGVLPLFATGRALFSAPGGLLADDASVAADLLAPAIERVRRERLDWLELRDQRRAWPGLETSTEHVTQEVPLERTAEAQWNAFPSKLRRHVERGESAGFALASGPGEVAAFHRVLLENLRDLGTPVRGTAYFRAALERLGRAADVLVLRLAGRAVGGMFVVRHGARDADPWVSALRSSFDRFPTHVLYWTALRRAIAAGSRAFDFGRSQPGSGVFRFKEQWGAIPVPLYYQYALGRARALPTLEDQKRTLAFAVAVWKRLPLPLAAALGEPVKRRFPEVM